jgi:hypothetical protein
MINLLFPLTNFELISPLNLEIQMQDVNVNVIIPSNATSIVGVAVTWIKNGGAPVTKNHSITSGLSNFTYTYLTDVSGGILNDGDTVSASVTTFDIDNLQSTSIVSTPTSVTIPSTPPAPPTSVTLALT